MPRFLAKRLAALLVLSFLIGLTGPALAGDRALLIGVGRYQNPKSNLPGVDKDLEFMVQAVGRLGFPSSGLRMLTNEQATLDGIRRAIETHLIQGASPADRVLFYFSGHGSVVRDASGDEPDGVDEVLVPYDFSGQADTCLIDDEFGALLARIPAGQVYVFIDACHSGSATRDTSNALIKFLTYDGMPTSSRPDGFKPETRFRGQDQMVLISAAQDDEQARCTSSGGYFTRGVAQSIERAAKENRSLTPRDVRDQAAAFIQKVVPLQSLAHHPNLFGNKALAETNLFRSASAAPSAPPAPEGPPAPALSPTPEASPPPDLWTRFEAFGQGAAYPVTVSANQTQLRLGEKLILSASVDRPGYLNVFHLNQGEDQATVLFPNQHHPDNQAAAGADVMIPGAKDRFALEAQPPAGPSLVLVLHTAEPFNAYQDGEGPAGLFRSFSTRSLAGRSARKSLSGEYGAGLLRITTQP